MKKLFIADEGYQKVFNRNKAKGHKRLVISDDVVIAEPIELVTEGTDLVMRKAEDSDEPEVYVMLCKEFGLVGLAADLKNKISVIHLEDGWMLVTLHNGALVMNFEDQLMMPTVGDNVKAPKVVTEDILWINANNLLEYSKFYGVKGNFMYDVEFMLIVAGDSINGLRKFNHKHLSDEDIDLSLGVLAQYEQSLQKKEEAKVAKKLANSLLNSSSSYEFDDDDEVAEDEEENEDGDYDDYL